MLDTTRLTRFLVTAFVILGICSDGVWALAAGSAGNWLRSNLGFQRAQRYFSGGVFVALGVALAATGEKRN